MVAEQESGSYQRRLQWFQQNQERFVSRLEQSL
jgi:hypothetical protein